MFHLTLIFYPHHTGVHSQMLYTNGSFEICQELMFVKQRRTHGWSTYLLSKKIFMLKPKLSNLYKICFNSVKKFLSNYLCTLHWHAFTNALHKWVIWNLPRANVCEAASNTQLKHLVAVKKNIYAQAKIIKSLQNWVIVYPHYIRNRSQWNAMWRDNRPHGYSRPILFPHSAKRLRDYRQNIPWLL